MKIMLDAGHGYSTPGKRSPDGMKEYEFNRAVAYVMRDELAKYEGVEVRFAHSDSRDVPLTERTNAANAWGADLYFSIHANANTGKMGDWGGIDTFVYVTRPAEATRLANAVQSNLIAATKLRDRGVKFQDFHVLREAKMTSILVEHGFMDSTTDLPYLKSNEYRQLCGVTNVKSIAQVYGLKLKASEKPKESIETKEEEIVEDGVYWYGKKMARGQVGRLTILKGLPLWSPEKTKHRGLNEGDVITVYRVKDSDNYKYEVGGGYTVSNVKGYVSYEAAPQNLVEANSAFYK